MQTFNNEIVIHRNETFTIDKTVKNKDGSPYCISSELNNPFFLISISTTRYYQQDRYVRNYWLNIDDDNFVPRFKSTIPVDLHSIRVSSGGRIMFDTFEEVTFPITAFIDDTEINYNYDQCVFYIEDDNGNRTYKYYDGTSWNDYICKIILPITQQDTKNWIEQSYVYSIQLVSGTLATDEEQQLNNGRRIVNFDTVITILPPTKLTVLSTIEGGL